MRQIGSVIGVVIALGGWGVLWGCTENERQKVKVVSDSAGESDSETTVAVDSDSTGVVSRGTDPPSSDDGYLDCEAAAAHRTYVGCEFWPTITYNMVWYNEASGTGFEFAVVVANDADVDAVVEISGGALDGVREETVSAGTVKAIVLPWVPDLKGTTFNNPNTSGNRVTHSVRADGGAYRLVSSVPVTAWQFSPLEYELSPFPSGCIDNLTNAQHCYSVTNDASMLIPSTAMTGTYRVFSYGGFNTGEWGDAPGGIAITAVVDNTLVRVQLTGGIASGPGIATASAGSTVEYTLQAGDVLQLLGETGAFWDDPHGDLTGSLVVGLDASDPGTVDSPHYLPVQVIGMSPIVDMTPNSQVSYADHIEETVLPAEALGHEYVVVPPTGSNGTPVQHKVRFVGSVDGTVLTYSGSVPAGVPTAIDAGQWAEVDTIDGFVVRSQDAEHPFMVVSYIQHDEPAVSLVITPEQFRDNYSFLAPVSYEHNYADIIAPVGASIVLDGASVGGSATPIGDTDWQVIRVVLNAGPGHDGHHNLTGDHPMGLQVMGYGHATSYYYPGGLDLDIISEPPPMIIIE